MTTKITPEKLAENGTESGHQKALFCWAAKQNNPDLKWMFAIPNGGLRNPITAARMKAEGAREGVWDIFLPVPQVNEHGHIICCGLFIEMKVGKNKLSTKQVEFMNDVKMYKKAVCYSWIEARDIIIEYTSTLDSALYDRYNKRA